MKRFLFLFLFSVGTIGGLCAQTVYIPKPLLSGATDDACSPLTRTFTNQSRFLKVETPGTCGTPPCSTLLASTDMQYDMRFEVDWGDGTVETFSGFQASYTHTFKKTTCNGTTHGPSASDLGLYVKLKMWKNGEDGNAAQSTLGPIKVWGQPDAKLLVNKVQSCIDAQPFTFTDNSDFYLCDLIDNYTYKLDYGDGTSVTDSRYSSDLGFSLPHTYTAGGKYKAVLSTDANNTCGPAKDTVEVKVVANPHAVAALPATPANYCLDASGKVIVSPTNSSTGEGKTFAWSVSPTTGWAFKSSSATDSLPKFEFNTAGTYTIKLVAKNACKSDSTTLTVVIKDKPVVTPTVTPTEICNGGSVTPSATVDAKSGTISGYNWTFTGGTPASSTSLLPGTVTYSTTGTKTLTFTATNECGTSASASKTVTVQEIPTASITNSGLSTCSGGSVTLTGGTCTGTNCGYIWYNGSATAYATTKDITVSVGGSYTLLVYKTYTAVTCSSSVSSPTTVTINPLPEAPVVSNQERCGSGTVTFTPTAVTGVEFKWYSSASGGTALATGASYTTPSISSTTDYYVEAYNTTTNCVSSTRTKVTATINPVPTAPGVTPASSCGDGTVVLKASGAALGYKYSWFDVTSGGTALQSNTSTNYTTASLTASKTYYVEIESDKGCKSTRTSVTATINPIPAAPSVTGGARCGTGSVKLKASGATSGYKYSWFDVTSGGTALQSNTSTDYTTASLTATKTYYVEIESDKGCKSTRTSVTATIFTVPPAPSATDVANCGPASMTLTASGSPSTYKWYADNTTTDVLATTASYTTPNLTATEDYYVSAYSADNCESERKKLTVTINTVPTVTVDSSGAAEFCSGNSVTLTATTDPTTGITYEWKNNDTVLSSTTNKLTVNASGSYTVKATIATTGCNVTSTAKVVTVNPLPPVEAGPDFSICKNEAALTLIGHSPTTSGGAWTGNGVSTAGVFDPASATATVGTHTLTYTYTDAKGCKNTDTRVATVKGIPTVNAGSDLSYCLSNENIALVAVSPTGGTWSGVGVTGSNFNPQTAGLSSGSGHVLKYTVTSGGCTNFDEINVVVTSTAQPDAGPDKSVCINSPAITLSATVGGGTWSGSPLLSGNTFTPSAAGTYDITYKVGTGTCLRTDMVKITVNALPVLTVPAAFTKCLNDAATTLTGFSPAGGTWSGAGITGTTFNPATAGTAASPHTLTYSYTDGNSCTNTKTTTATVNPLPALPVVSDQQRCGSGTVTFTPTAVTGVGFKWYSAATGGSALSTGAIYSPNITATTDYYVEAYNTTTNCATSTRTKATATLNIVPTVTVANSGAAAFCDGNSVTLTATPNPTTGITYEWKNGTTVLSSTTNTLTVNASGSYTVKATIATTGCNVTSPATAITVNPLPTVDAGPDFSICKNAAVLTLTGHSPTTSGGAWTGNGVSTAGVFDPAASATVGTHTLTYTYTDSNGCTNTDTRVAMVNLEPTVSVANSGAAEFCVGNPVTLTATPNPTSDITYVWSKDGSAISGASNSTLIVNASGSYTVKATIATTGCNITSTATVITVNSLPAVEAGANISLCKNAPAHTLTGFTPATGGAWSGISVTTAGVFTPASTPGTDGTYKLYYTFTDTKGCKNKDSLVVTVNPLPVVDAGADKFYCPLDTNILLVPINPPNGGTWSGAGVSGSNFNPQNAGLSTGLGHKITYTYIDPNGCTNFDTLRIKVEEPIKPNAGADKAMCINSDDVTLSATPTGGTWLGTNVTGSTFKPITSGIHKVVYSLGENTCLRMDTVKITVHDLPVLTVPTAFSVCLNDSATTLTGFSPLGGTWSGTGISGTSFNPKTAGVGASILTYSYTDGNNCTNTKTTTVTVNPNPVLSLAVTDTCAEETTKFTATSLTGGVASSILANGWAWNIAGTTTTQSSGTKNQTFTTSGPVAVTITVTDDKGCKDTLTRSVNILKLPKPMVVAPPVCHGFNTEINGISKGYNGAKVTGYSWNFNSVPGTKNRDDSLAKYKYTNAGTHPIKFEITDSKGCNNDTTFSVLVHALPTIDAKNDVSKCLNDGVFTLASATPSGGKWRGVGITDSLLGKYNPLTAGVGVKKISYWFTDANTCTNSDSVKVTIKALPNVSINPDTQVFCYSTLPDTLKGANPIGGVWSGTGVIENTLGIINPNLFGGIGDYNIFYQYTDPSTLCKNTDTAVVRLINPTDAYAGTDTSLCISVPNYVFEGYSPTGGNWSGLGINNGIGSISPNFVGLGTHKYFYTFGSKSCRRVDSVLVKINALPKPSFTISSICLNDTAKAVLGVIPSIPHIFKTSWYFGDSTPFSAIGEHLFSDTGQFTVKMVQITDSGCIDSTTQNIIVYSLPNARFSIADTCAYDFVHFTDQSVARSWPISTRTWQLGDGTTKTNQTDFTHHYSGPLVYPATLSITDGFGCKDTFERPVTIPIQPKANFGFTEVCFGDSSVFIDSSSALTGIASRLWIFGSEGTSDSINPKFRFSAASTYLVSLIIIDGNGCSDTISKNVKVIKAPTANFVFDSACRGSLTNFNNTSFSDDGQVVRYLWNFDTLDSSMAKDTSYLFPDSGFYNVSLKVWDQNTCFGSVTHQVLVLKEPEPIIVSPFSCYKSEHSFINNTKSFHGTTSYVWNLGDNTNVPTNDTSTFMHIYDSAGKYIVVLKAISEYGCFAFDTNIVSVKHLPNAHFKPDSVCASIPMCVVNLSTPTDTLLSDFHWTFNPGEISTDSAPCFVYPVAGEYGITLIVTDKNGCVDSTSEVAKIYPAPLADFSVADTCFGDSVLFADNSVPLSGNINSWNWTLGDGTIDSTDSIFRHQYLSAKKYWVRLKVTDNNGCAGFKNDSVWILKLPQANFYASNACVNKNVFFDDSILIGDKSISLWKWEFGVNNEQSDSTNPSFKYLNPGVYNVKLSVIDSGGCSSDTSKNIRIFRLPQADFMGDTVCLGDLTQITDLSQATDAVLTHWEWSFVNATPVTSLQQNPTTKFLAAGSNKATLLLTDANGCQDTKTRTDLFVNPGPMVNFAATRVCLNFITTFTDQSVASTVPYHSPIFTWNWEFGDGTNSSLQNPTHKYLYPDTFDVTLTITDTSGCNATITKQVIVDGLPVANFITSNVCHKTLANFFDDTDTTYGGLVSWKWELGVPGQVRFSRNTNYTYPDIGSYAVRLEVRNKHNCIDDTIRQLSVYPLPKAQFTFDTVCAGSYTHFNDSSIAFAANSGDTVVQWKWWFGDGSNSTDQNTSHIFPNAAIYNTKLWVADVNGCTDSITRQVLVYPSPVAKFLADSVCFTFETTFTDLSVGTTVTSDPPAEITGWKWEFGNSDTLRLHHPFGNIKYLYDSAMIYLASLTVTDTNGCSNRFSDSVVVYPLPNVKYSHDSVACVGLPEPFINQSTGSKSYIWWFGDGESAVSIEPAASTSHIYHDTGIYDVKLIAESQKGCTDSATSTIEVIYPPIANFVMDKDTGCGPLSVNFSNTTSGKYLRYYWDFGQGTIKTTDSVGRIVFLPSLYQDTTYYITLTVTNKCDTSIFVDSVRVFPSPWSRFAISTYSGCSPLEVDFLSYSTGLPKQFLWRFTPTDSSKNEIPGKHTFFAYESDTIYNISLITYNKCGTDTLIRPLLVKPNTIKAGFEVSDSIGCSPFSVTFFSDTGMVQTIKSYDFGNGNLDQGDTLVHIFDTAGIFVVKQIVTNSCGFDTAYQKITVLPKPKAKLIVNDSTLCIGQSVTLFNGSGGHNQSMLIIDTLNLNSFPDSGTFSFTKPTDSLVVRLMVSDTVTSCSDTSIKRLKVIQPPKVKIGSDADSICGPGEITFANLSPSALTPNWFFSNGKTSVQPNPRVYFNAVGAFSAKLKIVDLHGCAAETIKWVKVNPLPEAIFTVTPQHSCVQPFDLKIESRTDTLNSVYFVVDGQHLLARDTIVVINRLGEIPVKLIVQNQFNCFDTVVKSIHSIKTPNSKFSINQYGGCPPLLITPTPHDAAVGELKWFVNGKDTIIGHNPIFSLDSAGTFIFGLLATNDSLCTSVTESRDTVVVYPKPFVDFSFTMNHEGRSNMVSFENISSGADFFSWDLGNGKLYFYRTPEPQYYPLAANYEVILYGENEYECSDSSMHSFGFDEAFSLYIPNAFMPLNRNESTNIFKPIGAGLIDFHIQVFDLWGNLLWESRDLHPVDGSPIGYWDGRVNGVLSPAGSYTYKVVKAKFKNGTEYAGKRTGDVTLIK